eukprot:6196010-Pleurochrysis_carterae.AAC.1
MSAERGDSGGARPAASAPPGGCDVAGVRAPPSGVAAVVVPSPLPAAVAHAPRTPPRSPSASASACAAKPPRAAGPASRPVSSSTASA